MSEQTEQTTKKKTDYRKMLVEVLAPVVGKTYTKELHDNVLAILKQAAGTRTATTFLSAVVNGEKITVAHRCYFYGKLEHDEKNPDNKVWAIVAGLENDKRLKLQGAIEGAVEWDTKEKTTSGYNQMSGEGQRQFTAANGKRLKLEKESLKAFIAWSKDKGNKELDNKAQQAAAAYENYTNMPNPETKPKGFDTKENIIAKLAKNGIAVVQ